MMPAVLRSMLKHVAMLACCAMALPASAFASGPTILGAPQLGAGQTANGDGMPYDFFRISLEEGQHLHLVWDTMGANCCIRVRLYPPSVTDQNWRHAHPAYGRSIAGTLSLSSFTANAAGLWTLQVSAARGVANAPYTVIAMINPCFHVNGGLIAKLKAYGKCAFALGKTALKCGFAAAGLVRVSSRILALLKAAKDVGVIARLPARLRPLGRLLFHLLHAPIAKHAPQQDPRCRQRD
jgi:hypothetical protein